MLSPHLIFYPQLRFSPAGFSFNGVLLFDGSAGLQKSKGLDCLCSLLAMFDGFIISLRSEFLHSIDLNTNSWFGLRGFLDCLLFFLLLPFCLPDKVLIIGHLGYMHFLD